MATIFNDIILDEIKNWKSFFFFSCLVRLLKERTDQNAKRKKMRDSRRRQRERERQ